MLDWRELWYEICHALPVCRCDEPDDKPVSIAVSKPVAGHNIKMGMLEFRSWDLLKSHEGLRLKAYMPTPNDVWTIGYGHTKTAKPGMVITAARALELLDGDIAWAEHAVRRLVTVPLKQHQFDALVSFAYNVGAGAFGRSTLLRMLNAHDYDGAAGQFPRWNKQAGRVLAGLTKRRAEEQALFKGGCT